MHSTTSIPSYIEEVATDTGGQLVLDGYS